MYHWARAKSPFTLVVKNNLPSIWTHFVEQAVVQWTRSTVLDLALQVSPNPKDLGCVGEKGFVTLCESYNENSGWLGLTQNMIDMEGHITMSVVMMNAYYFQMIQFNNNVSRHHVACHEIGHALGLQHQGEGGISTASCMDTSLSPSSTVPNMQDYVSLFNIYNHVDTIQPQAVYAATPEPGKNCSTHTRHLYGIALPFSPSEFQLVTDIFSVPIC